MSAPPPAGWTATPLSSVATTLGGATPSKARPDFWEGAIPWVSPKDMKVFDLADSEDHVSESALASSALRLIPAGSVMIVVRGMILDHTVPVALNAVPVTLNQDMKALVPTGAINARFLAYQLVARNPELLMLVEQAGHGTCCLRTDLWRRFSLLVPPAPTQRAIVNFLDRKTAAIDELIRKKERLIASLHERAGKMIAAALAQSGAPTVPLRRLAAEPLRYGAQEAADGDDPSLPRFVRITDISTDGTLRPDTFKSLPWAVARPYLVKSGDILLARSGATVGKTILVSETWGPSCFAGYLIRLRPDPRRVLSEYLAHFFRSDVYREQIHAALVQATIQNVNADRYGRILVPVPHLDEQARLVVELNAVTVRLRAIDATSDRSVTLLRDYRSTLITAAVTGQLDVTAQAASAQTDHAIAEAAS